MICFFFLHFGSALFTQAIYYGVRWLHILFNPGCFTGNHSFYQHDLLQAKQLAETLNAKCCPHSC